MGYSGVGRVIACGKGVTEVQAGDLVAMVGTAYHCEINRVSRTMLTKVPEELTDYRQAAFCALGGIALEGIHQAEVVPGETVAAVSYTHLDVYKRQTVQCGTWTGMHLDTFFCRYAVWD